MNTVNDRIAEIVKQSGLTKTAFAAKLNVSQGYVSALCNGLKLPSERTIQDICDKFGVNEIWLRDGEGEPFQHETRQEEILRFASQTIRGSDEFKKAFVSMLAKLDADDWQKLSELFEKLSNEIKKGE